MHHSYTVVCISEKLKECAEKIAVLLKRKYVFTDNKTLQRFNIESEHITIVGLVNDFKLNVLSELMEKNVVFSVVAVKNENDLSRYYNKVYDHNEISLNKTYIEDFLNNTPIISEKDFFNSNACFFSGHGDYICFNMGNAVLCSKSPDCEKVKGKKPLCIIKNECYRKSRLKDNDAKLYSLQELKSEALFLNTCSGICFGNRKYDLCYDSMSDMFLKNKGLLFISNYMIGAYTHDETSIFFAMLIYYKNFALALCKYNQVVKNFYNKNKTAVMLGDVAIKAAVISQNEEKQYEIISLEKSHVIIKFCGKLSLNTITFEIAKNSLPLEFDLIDSVVIDKNNRCNYRVGILSEQDFYKVFIYINENGTFNSEIIFWEKDDFTNWSLTIYNQSKINSCILELFLFRTEYAKKLKERCKFWEETVFSNIEIQEMDKGNLEITTFAYNILKKATIFASEFNKYLLRCFVDDAADSNTHLILDNKKFFLREIKKNISICSVCHNEIWEMHMDAKSGVGKYIQYVCPECEIFYISSNYENKIDMVLEFEDQSVNIYLSKTNEFLNPFVGAMIINSNISTTSCKLLEDNSLVLCLPIKQENLIGMYYLRVVVFENKHITILHKRVYFD